MVPYLRAANVTWDGLDLSDVKSMNFTPQEQEIYRLRHGDVVLGEASGSPHEVGKPAIWRNDLDGCCFQNTLLRVRPNTKVVSSEFLRYLFLCDALTGGFAAASRGVGIHHLGAAAMNGWSVPLPSRAEQDAIVDAVDEELTRVDRGTMNLRRITRHATLFRRSLLEAELTHRSWPSMTLAEILSEPLINGRSVKDASTGFRVLRLTAVRNGAIDTTQSKIGDWSREDASRFKIKKGDFLIVRGNGSRDIVGRGGLVSSDDEVAFPDTMIRARIDPERAMPQYVQHVWDSVGVRRQIERAARTTAGILKVNQPILEGITLPLPTLDEQAKLVQVMSDFDASDKYVVSGLQRASRLADRLRASLLFAAFSGRLFPTVDGPIDTVGVGLATGRVAEFAQPTGDLDA